MRIENGCGASGRLSAFHAYPDLHSRLFQERGHVGQHSLPCSGHLAVMQTEKGHEYGIGYRLGCCFGAREEPVRIATVEQARQRDIG